MDPERPAAWSEAFCSSTSGIDMAGQGRCLAGGGAWFAAWVRSVGGMGWRGRGGNGWCFLERTATGPIAKVLLRQYGRAYIEAGHARHQQGGGAGRI